MWEEQERFMRAIEHHDILQVVLSANKMNRKYHALGLYFSYACQVGFPYLEFFLDLGADVNFNDPDVVCYTPLMESCLGGYFSNVQCLLRHGADVNLLTDKGESALHSACKQGGLDSVKLLIKNGANINAQEVDGFTPLHFASIHGQKDVVEFLLSVGADLNILTNSGDTAWLRARNSGQLHVSAFLEQYESQSK